jgi:hypothetical protein
MGKGPIFLLIRGLREGSRRLIVFEPSLSLQISFTEGQKKP